MSPDALQYLMAGAVIVSATALVLQAALLLALYKSFKEIRVQMEVIAGHTQSFLDSALKNLELSRKQISDVASKTTEVLDLARKQLVRVDGLLGDVTSRARVQIERADLIVEDALARLNETVDLFNRGILRPVREINAVAAGIQAGLRFLLSRRRLTPERATSDEEMFI
jgi:hypothetical protein